jgi:hypothetical protein
VKIPNFSKFSFTQSELAKNLLIYYKKVILPNFANYLLANVLLDGYTGLQCKSIPKKEVGIQVLADLPPSYPISKILIENSLADKAIRKHLAKTCLSNSLTIFYQVYCAYECNAHLHFTILSEYFAYE